MTSLAIEVGGGGMSVPVYSVLCAVGTGEMAG